MTEHGGLPDGAVDQIGLAVIRVIQGGDVDLDRPLGLRRQLVIDRSVQGLAPDHQYRVLAQDRPSGPHGVIEGVSIHAAARNSRNSVTISVAK